MGRFGHMRRSGLVGVLALAPLSVFVCAAAASASAGEQPAAAQLRELQERMRAARAAARWSDYAADAERLERLLNESPTSLLEVARARVHVGDLSGALAKVERFVRMGQSTEIVGASPEFAPLRALGGYADLVRGMEGNRGSISTASPAFSIPDASLLTEDLDYDPSSRRFFATSVRAHTIVAIDSEGHAAEFARSPDGWPMLALKIDPACSTVWATEVALQGFVFAPEADWGRSALLAYDLKTGRLTSRVEGPRGTSLGDIALLPQGDVILSDGEGGGVYRVAVGSAACVRIDDGAFISPQTVAPLPDGETVFVPDYVRGIAAFNVRTKKTEWLSAEGRFALTGTDGLYWDRGRLIAVQNGTSPSRVAIFTLDSSSRHVASETIVDRPTDDPTHGVVVGGDFYFVTGSGWNAIDEHGKTVPEAKAHEARILRARLPPR